MLNKHWKDNKDSFAVIDVRHLTNNFLPGLLKKAQEVKVGDGLCIVQSFEPKPLYSALADLGYDHVTEKADEEEYRVYFYRVKEKIISYESGADMPFKPAAILNYKAVSNVLAENVIDFWELIWGDSGALDLKTKLLLSMSNAVGASRFRQATRELIKAYSLGVTTAELDEIFSLFAWNQGIGYFSSEIGPSTLFGAYKQIKKREKDGIDRKTILDELLELFGDLNPDVNTLYTQERKRKNKQCRDC